MKVCPKCGRKCDDYANYCVKCAHSFENEKKPTEEKIYGEIGLTSVSRNQSGEPDKSFNTKQAEKKKAKAWGGVQFGKKSEKKPKEKKGTFGTGSKGKQEWKEEKKSSWPLLSGIIAAAAIIGIGVFFFIYYHNQAISDEKRIARYVEDIKTISDREQTEYLEEVREAAPGKEVYDQALEIKRSDDSDEEKLAALKSIYEELEKGDQKLIDKQTESLNDAYGQIQGKYKEGENKEFLITGEEERFQKLEEEYDGNLKGYHFTTAQKNLEDYKKMLENMSRFDDSSANYSAKRILLEDEFMPSVMDFSVSADSYGPNLDASHFVIAEKIGDGKAEYCKVTDVEASPNGKMVDYQVHFKTRNSSNYSDKRGYVLFVRNEKGDNGFKGQGGTLPEAMVQKAVGIFMKDFVTAFNTDCKAHNYDALANYINDDEVEDEYRSIVTADDMIGEAITNVDKNFKTFKIEDGGHCTMTTTVTYEIGKYRSWGEVSKREPERSWVRNNYRFQYYNGSEYIIFYNSSGELCGQILSQTDFKVKESLEEVETFSYTMTNTGISKITGHIQGDVTITHVDGLQPVENGTQITQSDIENQVNDMVDDYEESQEEDDQEEWVEDGYDDDVDTELEEE